MGHMSGMLDTVRAVVSGVFRSPRSRPTSNRQPDHHFMSTGHSDVCTRGIRVKVAAQFLPDRSDPELAQFLYSYKVIISNEGDRSARLLSRHWLIRDADNDLREVRGQGVVGRQPPIAPGEAFEYESHCPLPTEWGTMEGSYLMQFDDGETFEAAIGRFFLAPNVAPISQM